MSSQGGPSGGTKKISKNQKLNLPKSPSDAFEVFIDQGNIFDVREKTKKVQRFIPRSPSDGLEDGFGTEQFVPSSTKDGKRIGKMFKFDF